MVGLTAPGAIRLARADDGTDGGYASWVPMIGDQSRHFNKSRSGDSRVYWAELELKRAIALRKAGKCEASIGHLEPVFQKPNTSAPHPEHKVYPYLLKGMEINEPNKVWSSDITYIPMRRGFLYLVAIVDWYSRKILSWRLSNSLDADFCVAALEEALARFPKPEIFNTDQGCQFTSSEFTEVLKKAGVQISMDGRGRWRDNIIIERLWRSLKYESVYLHAYESGSEARKGIGAWIELYNRRRPHSSLDDCTPDEAYWRLPRQGYRYAAA